MHFRSYKVPYFVEHQQKLYCSLWMAMGNARYPVSEITVGLCGQSAFCWALSYSIRRLDIMVCVFVKKVKVFLIYDTHQEELGSSSLFIHIVCTLEGMFNDTDFVSSHGATLRPKAASMCTNYNIRRDLYVWVRRDMISPILNTITASVVMSMRKAMKDIAQSMQQIISSRQALLTWNCQIDHKRATDRKAKWDAANSDYVDWMWLIFVVDKIILFMKVMPCSVSLSISKQEIPNESYSSLHFHSCLDSTLTFNHEGTLCRHSKDSLRERSFWFTIALERFDCSSHE